LLLDQGCKRSRLHENSRLQNIIPSTRKTIAGGGALGELSNMLVALLVASACVVAVNVCIRVAVEHRQENQRAERDNRRRAAEMRHQNRMAEVPPNRGYVPGV
jgi:hypothetical protein